MVAMAADESSKKATSSNQIHNRFLTASRSNFTSEAKNQERQVENDVPSFNLADSDSPYIYLLFYDLLEVEKQQKVKIPRRRRLCKVVVKDEEEDHDFTDSTVKVEKQQKVKIPGRRRLCKVVVKDDEEDHDFTDSPSPVKNKEKKCAGGDEIRDIFNSLSPRFKHPTKQVLSSSDSVTKENFNQQQAVEFSKPVDVEGITEGSRKENFNGGYVKKHVGKAASKESFTRLNKSESDEDCVVTPSKPKFSLPVSTRKILYPHQLEGLEWLWSLHCKGKGGILGDDMGLGKTMQICSFLAGLFHSKLIKWVLVVAPKTLLPHWLKELGVVGLSQKTREYLGTRSKARQYELQDTGILLTAYDIVRNNVKSLSGDYDVTWDYMILDEGHYHKES